MTNKISMPWYLIPIVFGIVGSVIMWIILRDEKTDEVKKFIRNSWIIGAISIVGYNIPWVFLLWEMCE